MTEWCKAESRTKEHSVCFVFDSDETTGRQQAKRQTTLLGAKCRVPMNELL